LPGAHAYTLSPGHPTPGLPNFLRPPIASTIGAGILTRFPSATTFVLTLGADSPSADERGGGNLGLSASEPFTRFIATHVSIRTSDTSSMPYDTPSPAYGTLSYHVAVEPNARTRRVRHLLAQVPSPGRITIGTPDPHSTLLENALAPACAFARNFAAQS
jgi:hypothetical protein